jgi:signal transduction histidine kinase
MRRSIARRTWGIFAATILTIFLAGFFLAHALVEEGTLISSTYHQGTWGAVQNDAEALKLIAAIERFRRTGAPADRDALAVQRELFLSRVYFLRDAEETAQVRSVPELKAKLAQLFDAAGAIDAAVDRLIGGDASAADGLQKMLAEQRARTRDITQYLLLQDSTLLNRGRMLALFEQMVACVLLILAASGLLVFLALREAKAARLAREAASRDRARLESALDGAADPFIVSDRAGKVVFANNAYRELLGADATIVAPGAPLGDAIEAEAARAESAAEFATRALMPHTSFLAKRQDGRTYLCRAERTSEGGLVLTRTDLSDRLRLERERSEYRDQFHHAMKMEALGRLAGGIAHDFNNILAAILSFSQMLSSDLADRPVQQKMATKIVGATRRAAGLVQQILSFARKDHGDQRGVDLVDIAREALGLLRATTPQSILTSFTAAPGAVVVADPGQLSQVVMNLCVNARDAIGDRPGAIEIQLEHPAFDRGLPHSEAPPTARAGIATTDIDTQPGLKRHLMHVGAMAPDKRCVCLNVRDNGGGIPRNVLERMFEPFYTTKGVGSGSGLGLAAVHGIVLSLNGTIMVDTVEGSGTSFRIYIPLAEDAAAQAPAPERDPAAVSAA